MEDMSKKTKKLEKENENFRRKEASLNQNIFKMAEERNKYLKDNEDANKKNEKLTSIINQMQQQGRGIPAGMQSTADNSYPVGAEGDEGEQEGDDEEQEGENGEQEGEDDSECEYDEEAEEQVSEEEEFDDDTEEEVPKVPGAYGPERPPAMNGHR
jgi:hypothetical protein